MLLPVRDRDAALPEAGNQQQPERDLRDHERADNAVGPDEVHPDRKTSKQESRLVAPAPDSRSRANSFTARPATSPTTRTCRRLMYCGILISNE